MVEIECEQCNLLLREIGNKKRLLETATKRIKVLEQDLGDEIRIDKDKDEIMMCLADELSAMFSHMDFREDEVLNIINKLRGE
jgi:thioredoxin-related protein